MFNKILYFDWYFSGGAGVARTAVDRRTNASQAPNFQEESQFAFFLGTGHQYHISQSVVARLDFMTTTYRG